MATIIVKDVADVSKIGRRMRGIREGILRELKKSLRKATLILEREVVERTPVGIGNSAQGHARETIFSELRNRGTEGVVAGTAEHLEAVEFGSRAHWPPKGALRDWVRLKMGVPESQVDQVEFLVRRHISIHGTPAHEMFQRGWDVSRPRIKREMALGARRALAKADRSRLSGLKR